MSKKLGSFFTQYCFLSLLVSSLFFLNHHLYADIGPFQGTWKDRETGLTFTLHDNGHRIESLFTVHKLWGQHLSSDEILVEIERTANGCTVILYGRYTLVTPSYFRAIIEGTSGQCGFPSSWRSFSIFDRI